MSKKLHQPMRGRGAAANPDNRYRQERREWLDDGWGSLEQLPQRLETTLEADASRTVISYNDSPDVPHDRSINPYRGCEHGCIYCFARPSHAWLGLSPGLDFETRLFYKPDAAKLLRKELAAKNYRCAPIGVGINTDAYQPAERRFGITRQCLAVLAEARHPLSIITKSSLIERDIDILAPLAAEGLVSVAISLTTLDRELARRLEPRAAAPQRRLETIRRLSEAGIPVLAFVAPLIPVLTDSELERIMQGAREAGAVSAGYIMLRLPLELEGLFTQWLEQHEPLKAAHVMQRIYDIRGGKANDSTFGVRMRGSGHFATLIHQRFHLAYKKLGFKGMPELDCSRFRPPPRQEGQLSLF